MAGQQQQNISNEDPLVAAINGSNTSTVTTTQYIKDGNTFITNKTEVTNIRISGPSTPAGNTSEVQFNFGGRMEGDEGLSYNPTTDSLTVLGNLDAGAVYTNNLKYANGSPWVLGSTYGNSDVYAYLPTYVGNLNPNVVSASLFQGSGANLTNIPGSNVSGPVQYATVANSVAGGNVSGTVGSATTATTATRAGTVTTAAQPNITSIGTLTGIASTGTVDLTGAGNISLGAIGNIHITGGSTGQVLSTDGAGTLSWSTPTTGTLQDVTTNGATTSIAMSVTNSTATTSTTTGALKVTGGVGIQGGITAGGIANITNTTDSTSYSTGSIKTAGGLGVAKTIHGGQHISAETTFYAGHLADFSSWTAPKFIGRDAGATYIQGALVNTDPNGSADWVAYGDQSDDANGWCDFGFTGTTFSDPLYSITKENDGYLIVQGMPSSGGNLVLATGEKGGATHRDIVFATGGFLLNNERMRLNHEDQTLYVGAHGEAGGTNVTNLDLNGKAYLRNNVEITGHFTPTANVTYDLGNATHRFRDLYLSGSTINLGGTLIQAQANGEVSIGNATFTSNGTISATSVTKEVRDLANTANTMSSTDNNVVVINSGDSSAFYVSNDTNLTAPIGTEVTLIASLGNIMIMPTAGPAGSGVGIYISGNLVTQASLLVPHPYGRATLIKLGPNTWHASGNLM